MDTELRACHRYTASTASTAGCYCAACACAYPYSIHHFKDGRCPVEYHDSEVPCSITTKMLSVRNMSL